MSEPTIICPKCKTEIKLTESLAAPLVTELSFLNATYMIMSKGHKT